MYRACRGREVRRVKLCCVLALATCLVGGPAFAQEAPPAKPKAKPAAKSSPAAVQHYQAARAFQNRGVYDLAIPEWQDFLKKYPDDPLADRAQFYLGVCQFQLKEFAEAEKSFAAAIANHPQSNLLAEAYYNQGLAQYNQGQAGDGKAMQRAAASFTALGEKFAESDKAAPALFYRAESLYSLNKKKEAEAAYSEFVARHEKSELRPQALYGLGVAQEELNQPAAAQATYALLLKEFPDFAYAAEVEMRSGDALFAQGNFDAALVKFEKAAGIEGFALADYAMMRAARCLFEQEEYAAAADRYTAMVEKHPESQYAGTSTLAAGKCYYLAGKMDPAETWLAKAGGLGGDVPFEVAHWRSRIALKQDRPADALKLAAAELPKAQEAKSTWAADLAMDRAEAMYEIADQREASIDAYAKFADAYPQHASAPQALYMAGFAALDVGKLDQAGKFAADFLTAYADHQLTADVMYVASEASLLRGDYDRAAAQYGKLLADHGNRPEASNWMLRRALALQLAGKHTEAIAALEGDLAQFKKPEQLAEAQFILGASQFELEKHGEAAASLTASREASTSWRQADEALLLLARAQHAAKNTEQAIETATRLITDYPSSKVLDAATYWLGDFLAVQKKDDAAAEQFAKVLETWPKGDFAPYAAFQLGWTQFRRNQYDAAAKSWTSLIENHPDHAQATPARLARARAYNGLKQFSPALDDVNAYLDSVPEGVAGLDAKYVKGLALVGLNKFSEAAEQFQAILDAKSDYADAENVLYELAWAQLELKEKDQAAEAFGRLVKEFPDSKLAADAHFRLGEIHYQGKDYGKAARAYYDALNKAGGTVLGERATHMLGWSYFQQEDYEKAHGSFTSQIATFPDGDKRADGQVMLAESLFMQNKHKPALAEFEKALALNDLRKDFEERAWSHAAQSALQLEAWEKAGELAASFLEKFPESSLKSEAQYTQARALVGQGEHAEAMKVLDEIADGATLVGAKARFLMGEILFLKDNYTEAVRNFFRVAYGYGYPKTPEAFHAIQADATFEAARCFENLKNTEKAKELYQELIERFPNSSKAADAKEKVASLG